MEEEEETAVPAAGWIPADGPDLWGPLGGPGTHRPKAHADVRISNMSLILRHLQTSPALSRTRLARETGLSKATVSTLVAELCSRGLLIEEEPDLSGNVGRPSTGLRTAPRTAAGIGLEISGASLLLSITDLTGEVVARRCELVDDAGHRPETMIEHVAAMLSQALEQLTQQGTTVPGIVLAQTGIIDYTHNTVRYSSTLEWHDVAVADQVRDAVARRLGPGRSVPTITLENDAKLAALATYERYAQDGVRNLLYLSGGEGTAWASSTTPAPSSGASSPGGLTVRGHIPGKDGVYAGSLLVEAVAASGKRLSELYADTVARYGELVMVENAYGFTSERHAKLEERIFSAHDLPAFTHDVERVSWQDGCKVYFACGGWVTIRFSGTEPLLRVFAEMPTDDEARATADAVASHDGLDA